MNMTRKLFIRILAGSLALSAIMACDDGVEPGGQSTVADIDGNVYHTVKIGNQVWTVENLRTTRFNDGGAIPLAQSDSAWALRATPGYCFFNNTADADSIEKFGALYNWYAASAKNLAPAGWHVPTASDWQTLENYLEAGGYNWDGTTTGNKIARALAARTDWAGSGHIGGDLAENDKSGFSALPGGSRADGSLPPKGPADANFYSMGYAAYWWSSSPAAAGVGVARHLEHLYEDFEEDEFGVGNGMSIRLIRD